MKFRPGVDTQEGACSRAGFTMVELVISVAIIGILAVLVAPEIGPLRDRAGKVVCVGHLRSLHCSLGAYLNDNEQWPKCPESLSGTSEDQFWIDELKDYGAPESVWHCPSLVQRFGSAMNDPNSDVPKIHYTPSEFDENPMTPRRWAAHPWLIEIDGVHGRGALYIRTDGAVQSEDDAIKELQTGGS